MSTYLRKGVLSLRYFTLVALALCAAGIVRAADFQAGKLKLQLDSQTGKVLSLSVGAAPVPLRAPAAIFQLRDVKAHSDFVPLTGPLHKSGGDWVMEATAGQLGLAAHISFHVSDGILAYRADILDTTHQERGLVVSTTLPFQPTGLVYERYLPLARKLNDAGWEPVTGVIGEGPGIVCERFGKRGSGPVYVTLFNDGAGAVQLVLRLEESVFGSSASAAEIGGERPMALTVHGGRINLPLAPGELKVLQMN